MSIQVRNPHLRGGETSTPVEIKTLPLENPGLKCVTSSVGLQFDNGYEFRICIENKKMVIYATMNGKEVFYLDTIPQEFIDSLKMMLGK